MDKVVMDLKMINKTEQEPIARQILPLVKKYFEDKSVQADFKKWLQHRKKVQLR